MSRTCLIAENDPFIAALLERFAEASALLPLHAGIGQDVVEVARRSKPAVIILDLELPGKVRGWEAAVLLGSDAELQTIPLILCCWPETREMPCPAHVVAGYLQKPDLHYDDFVAALRQAGLRQADLLTDGLTQHNGEVPAAPVMAEGQAHPGAAGPGDDSRHIDQEEEA